MPTFYEMGIPKKAVGLSIPTESHAQRLSADYLGKTFARAQSFLLTIGGIIMFGWKEPLLAYPLFLLIIAFYYVAT